jgi:threonine/homoserine/homoserine lactone efflux protein
MDAVLKGIAFGLVLAMLIGPVFFALIETSIEKGFFKGIFVAIGISLSDTLYIVVSYFGLTNLLAEQTLEKYLGYVGGVILIGFGIFSFFKSLKKKAMNLKLKSKSLKRYIFRGFIINGLNPMVLFFWIGAIGLATVEYQLKGNNILTFFATIILTVFLSDVLKAYLAHKLRVFVTRKLIRTMNIITGMAMIIFGIHLLIYAGPAL